MKREDYMYSKYIQRCIIYAEFSNRTQICTTYKQNLGKPPLKNVLKFWALPICRGGRCQRICSIKFIDSFSTTCLIYSCQDRQVQPSKVKSTEAHHHHHLVLFLFLIVQDTLDWGVILPTSEEWKWPSYYMRPFWEVATNEKPKA